MVATKAVAALETLGLSTYEARAYAALLRTGPVTGYQLSRHSGVPRSRIYEALEKLGARGMVIVRHEKPQLYAAADWEAVQGRRALEFRNSMEKATACCAAMTRPADLEGVWSITGRDAIFTKVVSMVRSAKQRISVAGWAEDFGEIESALADADRRGVAVRLVVCGSFRPGFGEVYHHSFATRPGDDVVVVADSKEALVGQTLPEEMASAAWSREKGFVHVSLEYIVHEIFIARLLEHVEPEKMASLGEMYSQIVEAEG